MLLLNLNCEAFGPATLQRYHAELSAILADHPLSSAERQAYRATRERVATLIAFPDRR